MDLFVAIKPTRSYDEFNDTGGDIFWVVVDAYVRTVEFSQYVRASESGAGLAFSLLSDAIDGGVVDSESITPVPFPDDVDIRFSFDPQTPDEITVESNRSSSYRFIDRDGFLALNRDSLWPDPDPNGMEGIPASFDRFPSLYNEALRRALAAAADAEDELRVLNFAKTINLGASRLISRQTVDLPPISDNLMMFGDPSSDPSVRSCQHSLNGQLLRFPVDKVVATIGRLSLAWQGGGWQARDLDLPSLSTMEMKATAVSAFTAPIPSNDIIFTRTPSIENRLYIHGRWSACERADVAAGKFPLFFLPIPPRASEDVGGPCGSEEKRSLIRVSIGSKAPGGNWGQPQYDPLKVLPFLRVVGTLSPYRGFSEALPNEHMLWRFVPSDDRGASIVRKMTDQPADFAIALVYLENAVLDLAFDSADPNRPLRYVGAFDLSWDATKQATPSAAAPTVLFWSSARSDIAEGPAVVLIRTTLQSDVFVARRTERAYGRQFWWQNGDDTDNLRVVECDAFMVRDTSDVVPPSSDALTVEVLEAGEYDFELANSARRFETRLTSRMPAEAMVPANAMRAVSPAQAVKAGYKAFATYYPTFSESGALRFRAAKDAEPEVDIRKIGRLYPIAKDAPSPSEYSYTYHLSGRQEEWDKQPDDPATVRSFVRGLYGKLGTSLLLQHVIENTYGQRLIAQSGDGDPLYRRLYFVPSMSLTSLQMRTAPTDPKSRKPFIEAVFDENSQTLTVRVRTEFLDPSRPDASASVLINYWKMVAELARSKSVVLNAEFHVYYITGTLDTPVGGPAIPVMIPVSTEIIDPFSEPMSKLQLHCKDWLDNGPPTGAGGVLPYVDTDAFVIKTKKPSPKISEAAHAFNAWLNLNRPDNDLPDASVGNLTLRTTFRPGFKVTDVPDPAPQATDAFLRCLAQEWLLQMRTSDGALTQSDQDEPGGLFLAQLSAPFGQTGHDLAILPGKISPAPGKVVASVLPVGFRPLMKMTSFDVGVNHVAARVITLFAKALDCRVPAWRATWTEGDWTDFFVNMQSTDPAAPMPTIYGKIADLLNPVPALESQSVDSDIPYAAAIFGTPEIQVPFRRRLSADLIRDPELFAKRSNYLISVVRGEFVLNNDTSLPSDFAAQRIVLDVNGNTQPTAPEETTVAVRDYGSRLSERDYRFVTSFALPAAKYSEQFVVRDFELARAEALFEGSPRPLPPDQTIEVSRLHIPGGFQSFAAGAVRQPIALPLTVALSAPLRLAVANPSIAQNETAWKLWVNSKRLWSRNALKAGTVEEFIAGADDGALAYQDASLDRSRSSRADSSVRLLVIRIQGIATNQGAKIAALSHEEIDILSSAPASEPAEPEFNADQAAFLSALSDNTPVELVPELSGLNPQSPYFFLQDGDLAKLFQPAALLDPPIGDVGKISFALQAGGTVQLVVKKSLPLLSLDVVVLAEDSVQSPTEFYLVLAMQIPIWYQEKLWLRQARDRARSNIIGWEFVQHATTPLTGVGTPMPKQFDLASDTPAELSQSEAASISAEALVRRTLIDTIGIIPADIDSMDWRQYMARITIFHKPQVALPSIRADGSIAFGTVPLYPKDTTFPIISIRLDDANAWFNAITLPSDISLFEMSITWFAQADLAPFFAVERRVFRVV